MAVSILIFSLVAILCMYTVHAQYYSPKWQLLTLFASGLLCFKIGEASNIYFGLLYFWLLWPTTLIQYDYTPTIFEKNNIPVLIRISRGQTGMALFTLGIIYLFLTKNIVNTIFNISPYLIFIDGLMHFIPKKYRYFLNRLAPPPEILAKLPNWKPKCLMDGICANPSTTATMLSILFAMTLTSDVSLTIKGIAFLSMIWSMVNLKASAGLLGFLFSSLAYLVYNEYWLVIGFSATLFLGFLYTNWSKLISDSGRIEIYKKSLNLHTGWMDRFLGLGNAGYKVLGPMKIPLWISEKHKRHSIVIWTHNDLLQFFLDSGIVGCIIGLAFFISIAINFDINHWILFLAILPNLIFNFPTHLAESSFILTVVLRKYFYEV